MYLGWMHAASTTDSTSVHITLGVMSYTWADLLADSLSELVDRIRVGERTFHLICVGRWVGQGLEEELSRRIPTLSQEMDLHSVAL